MSRGYIGCGLERIQESENQQDGTIRLCYMIQGIIEEHINPECRLLVTSKSGPSEDLKHPTD